MDYHNLGLNLGTSGMTPPTPTPPRSLSQFLWHYVLLQKWSLSVALLMVMLLGFYPSANNYIMKILVDHVADATAAAPKSWLSYFGGPVFLFILCFEITNILWRIYDYMIIQSLPYIREQVVADMYRHIESYRYSYFVTQLAGNISNKIADMARSLTRVIEITLHELVQKACIIIVAIASMSLVHPLFSLILLVWGVVMLGISIFCMHKTNQYVHLFAQSRSRMFGRIIDQLVNILSIKLTATSEQKHGSLDHLLDDTRQKDQAVLWFLLKVRYFQGLSLTLMISAVAVVLMMLRDRGQLTVGDIVFVISLSSTIARYIWQITQNIGDLSEVVGACTQALDALSPTEEAMMADNIVLFPGKAKSPGEEAIALDHIYFSHEDGTPMFSDLHLTIKQREKLVIIGPSGSGKTTLLKLIAGLHHPEKGSIYLEGRDITLMQESELRQTLALVPQNPILMHLTIMENIRYAAPKKSEKEITAIAKALGIHEMIVQLKDGYHTLVGEQGIRLSGGQRQLIAILRAAIQDCPIMLLDEPTSSLDEKVENRVLERLFAHFADRTLVIVSHRRAVLDHAERVLVLEHGTLTERKQRKGKKSTISHI